MDPGSYLDSIEYLLQPTDVRWPGPTPQQSQHVDLQ